jgi:uncharacterized protein YbjQ (UPF0145 family)
VSLSARKSQYVAKTTESDPARDARYAALEKVGWEEGLAADAVPVAFVLGTCVYHIAHQGVLQSLRQAGQNQEMLQFTQGVYEARELALARMQAEAAQARSSGIVGVSVEVANHVWGEHATEFLATGTAIRRLSEERRLPETSPKPTFTLGLDQ